MINPPFEEIKMLAEYAKKEGLVLGSSMDESCIVILMGRKDLVLSEIAIVCAFMCLQGVLNGAWNSAEKVVVDEGETPNGSQNSSQTH